jgi:dolichyl-diphosphooligosaccharide--protein glycosyltransferase/undecaprenyl-diphosphooligosaccharide--protein glycosyltransferase
MLHLPQEELSSKKLFLLIAIAFIFSVAVRLIWVFQFHSNPAFIWEDQLMINTNDGYFFASGAQKVLEGMHQFNPRVPDVFQYGVVFFTTWLVKLTPFDLNTVILYLPALISSLVVIPIILISRLYGATSFGFFSALIGSIAWSYYNRTMVGYYDTDMFAAMAPMFILYFLMASIKQERLNTALYASLMIFIYPFLYDAGRAIVYAMGLIYIVYMYIFHRKDEFTPKSIILIAIGLTPLFYLLKLALIIAAYIVLRRDVIKGKNLTYLSYGALAFFLIFGNIFGIIWGKVDTYLFRGVEESGLHFFQVKQTVREAGTIPFSTMANRISGSTLGVIASLIGYLLLLLKHRHFILALPLIGIGIFSLWGGLRFTVYAVPVAAMGAVYLFYVITSTIVNAKVRYGAIALLTALMLYPNITHIIGYKVPTVLNNPEVKTLTALKQSSSPKDYVIAWWDYGYPLWYYSNLNTLIDGGKHNHDNFIVSEILSTTSQLEAARLSRIAVQTYISSDYKTVADTLFKNKKTDQLNVPSYLETLRYGDVTLPKKTVETYLYLPFRMMNIFPTVKVFSNIDLNGGEKRARPFFYNASRFQDRGDQLYLGNNISILKKEGMLQLGNQKTPIKAFYTVSNKKVGKPSVKAQHMSPRGAISVIYMASYNQFLLLDDAMLNSTYIQLFVFENYDHDLFELVSSDPYSKIYRVKL